LDDPARSKVATTSVAVVYLPEQAQSENPAEVCLTIKMTFDGWHVIDFPAARRSLLEAPKACVYVFCFGTQEVPFYVGESGRFGERIENDYRLTKWNGSPLNKLEAPTDFCVAEAAAYLKGQKGQHIKVKYKQSSDDDGAREKEEAGIIDDLVIEGWHLVNCLRRFKPKQTSAESEREKIGRFCDMLCKRGEL
jgi:hypothetical protein